MKRLYDWLIPTRIFPTILDEFNINVDILRVTLLGIEVWARSRDAKS